MQDSCYEFQIKSTSATFPEEKRKKIVSGNLWNISVTRFEFLNFPLLSKSLRNHLMICFKWHFKNVRQLFVPSWWGTQKTIFRKHQDVFVIEEKQKV